MIIKLLFVTFFLFALSRAVLRFRDGNINGRELVFLCLLWIGASVVVLWPQLTMHLARVLGVGRGSDAIVYITVAALCYFIFRIYIRIRHIEQQLTGLVRKLALREAEQTPSREESPPSR
ncbi:MAG: DUF2304 family protein [Verrucomicrobia bacterium]|nr:DUF2304 family protein [Verrucomicrobiota bacterium]